VSPLLLIGKDVDGVKRVALSRLTPKSDKEFATMEPSAKRGVYHRKSNVTSPIEKGFPSCISRIFCSPSLLRLDWPLAVTQLGSKLLVVVRSVPALLLSQAEASRRVLQLVQVQTYLPASLAQFAVNNCFTAALSKRSYSLSLKQPRSADADAGFFRVLISKGMAHV
tara:strand:- start:1768 stop:2268 length:501 start_codon:yes stop_codon:yes gene_type:complete